MRIPYDLFNERGELLITRGITLSQSHIDLLRRRNIFDVYYLEPFIEDHGKAEPKTGKPADEAAEPRPGPRPIESFALPSSFAADYEKLRRIQLEALLRSPLVLNLEHSLKSSRARGRPVGASMRGTLRQIFPSERTDAYKRSIESIYFDILEELADVFMQLLSGQRIDMTPLRRVADRLISMYIDDASLLVSLAGLKEEGDAYLLSHTLNVCILSINIAAAAGYSRKQVAMIGLGGLLHDIGMFLVPRDIWDKSDKLDRLELEEIQKHPVTGIHILDNIRNLPEPIRYIAFQSHERENGSGYPRRRRGGGIHGYAKIIQIADIFEALTSERTYRPAYTPFEAIEVLIGMSRKAMLAKPLLRAFLSFTSLFPVGSIVELSDQRLARVIQANPRELDKPLVSIVAEPHAGLLAPDAVQVCDLADTNSPHIIRAFSPWHCARGDVLSGF
jgi:HD-GYP domain-containing protein (c-di-GMP phosphodiesterase class II)